MGDGCPAAQPFAIEHSPGDSRVAEETVSRVFPVPVPTRSTANWNSGKSIEELDPKPIKNVL